MDEGLIILIGVVLSVTVAMGSAELAIRNTSANGLVVFVVVLAVGLVATHRLVLRKGKN